MSGIIDGSTQIFEDQVKIRIQLINAKKDEQIRAETFDGNRKNILFLQSKIAKQRAEKFQTVLTRE